MLRKLIPALSFIILLGSCTSLKPIAFNNKQAAAPVSSENKEVKFLDDISSSTPVETGSAKKEVHNSGSQSIKKETAVNYSLPYSENRVEKESSLQFKYATLLNTDVDDVQNFPLYRHIDEWYGTRYQLGGTTKSGIDCSAFVQTIFTSTFGITLPRTAREQYKYVQLISTTQLKEGDLLFFNTTGGVSHVGIYLQNNKFVHASVSGGVTISDMFDPYYVRHFIGAGRTEGDVATFHPENIYPKAGTTKKKSKHHSSKKKTKK
jgi:cell wall-associated NlpC family hydrolase